jgi:hypothetical protein
MYSNFERRPTATEEKLSQYSGKLKLQFGIESGSEEEKSSKSNASGSARGYKSMLSPVKIPKTPHNIPPRKFSNQFDGVDNEAKNS